MKKLLTFLLTLLMLCAPALAEAPYESVRLEFEDGFALSLPADWVSYAVSPELAEAGYLYCLGSADGARLMYIQRWNTDCADLDELRALLEDRDEILLRSDMDDSAFLMYNFAEQDCSGCATLLNDSILNLIFLPQSDADNMLIAATILESYEAL